MTADVEVLSPKTDPDPPVLSLDNLKVRFASPEGEVRAVNGVSLTVHSRETLGVVGESGSGKSQTFLAVMGLLAANARVEGRARYRDQDLLSLEPKALDTIRGGRMTMIFQDPMTSLNPFLKVGIQLTEVLVRHLKMDKGQARRRAVEMMERVRIPEPARRLEQYPHEFSGGMRQRVMIAMSLLCNPDLLIADEPTTALDVTIQAQILDLLNELKTDFDTAIVMITHDLGVVAELCDRVLVMYAGGVMETGRVEDIFYHPQHPYTAGLLASTPRLDETAHEELLTIPGQPPNLQKLPPVGCPFAHRCPHAFDRCLTETPLLREVDDASGHRKACHLGRLEGAEVTR